MKKQTEDLSKNNTAGKAANNADLLRAVNKAASLLLTVNDLNTVDDVFVSALGIIGSALDADRVTIWHNEQVPDSIVLRRQYTWVGEHGLGLTELPVKTIPSFENAAKWIEELNRGNCVGWPISSLNPDEQEYFSDFNAKSICFIPLFCAEVFWGLISIGLCRQERTFSDDEIVTLKSLGLMVASVLNYKEIIADLSNISESADAANKAKNAFLSNMSHEVRTPLNAIVGMTGVGLNTDIIGEKDYALSKIGDASSHLLEIINNVLEMASIENGTLQISPVEFSFRDMLERAISSMRPMASEKDQSFEIHVDDNIPQRVIGDAVRLTQLVSNLLSNAVKFTPIYGRIGLDVTLEKETHEHVKLRIVVKDNGIGIPEENRDGLFVPFEQVHGAISRDYGGTGLGLPISKRIVELMDGHIWLESEPNRGTTVYLTIQLIKTVKDVKAQESREQEAAPAEHNASSVIPGEFKGKRLLIVEDVEINREILIALLKESELIIECAEDGQVAVDMVMFNVEKYDVVFMDLQMPNMGGLESTQHIRMLPERKRGRLPIIAMTANTLPEDIKACMDAGMDDHLSKPLDIEKVLAMLRKYLL